MVVEITEKVVLTNTWKPGKTWADWLKSESARLKAKGIDNTIRYTGDKGWIVGDMNAPVMSNGRYTLEQEAKLYKSWDYNEREIASMLNVSIGRVRDLLTMKRKTMDDDAPDGYVSAKRLAEHFGKSIHVVYNWKKKNVPHKSYHSKRWYKIEEIEEWLKK